MTAPSAPPTRVLFISGWGRSGSTLLDRMLSSSLGFFASGELREVWWRGVQENRQCGCGVGFNECPFWRAVGIEAFGGWDHEDADARAQQRLELDRPWHVPQLLYPRLSSRYHSRHRDYVALLSRLYAAIQATSGAPVIVDSSKIPMYAMLLREAPGIDLRMLHLVRDSRGVAYSWQKTVVREDGGGQDEMYRYGIASTVARYDGYNLAAQTVARWGTPYLRVRYEDLVAEPLPTLRTIARFAWDSPLLDAGSLADGVVEFGRDHTVDGNPIRFQTGPVSLRLDDTWRTELSPTNARVTTAATAPLLMHYRYPLRLSRPDDAKMRSYQRP